MKIISFVIPCYGSEKTIRFVVDEIRTVVSQEEEFDYEIIAVNDCSPDGVWNVIKALANDDNRIKGVHLSKNANRPGAVMAGLSLATGEYVVIMDDDGQCPMDRFWDLLKPVKEGISDVAMADYPERKQSFLKDIGTLVNKKMTEFIIDRPKELQFTNFMVIKRYIVDEILKYDNPYPYMTGLLLRTTQYFSNVTMDERKRVDNIKTTFTFNKMLSLWFNGLTAFSVKPLRLATILGLFSALVGAIYSIITFVRKLLIQNINAGYSSIMCVLLIIGGLIMVMLGIIGEYVGRLYICINKSPQYVIKEMININEKAGVAD